MQDAADNAVNITGKKAMIVVIKPSTGEILAVAQNAAADADGPIATTGLYPPGSTFKIITAGAAIDRDMVTPNTLLDRALDADRHGLTSRSRGFIFGFSRFAHSQSCSGAPATDAFPGYAPAYRIYRSAAQMNFRPAPGTMWVSVWVTC